MFSSPNLSTGHDNIPDIYDNDGVATGDETGESSDPYYDDSYADYDSDGLINAFELELGLNPLDNDTDHDGVEDGAEYFYWILNRGLDESTAAAYCRNPDADNDSIPDGKEIYGYTVKIITGWKDDDTPISQLRFITPDELDPLRAYANRYGEYTDTDMDGIPDVVEVWFSNASRITDWRWVQEFVNRFGWGLYLEYSGALLYYMVLEARENKSVADEWLREQFNPLVVDNEPPAIIEFTVSWYVEWSADWNPVRVYADVHLLIWDASGVESVAITDHNTGECEMWSNLGKVGEVWHRFGASALDSTTGSVSIGLTAVDVHTNDLYADKELKGVFRQVLDALKAIWDAIWDTLCKVAEAVMKAVNVILEWIKGLFMSIVQKIIGTIKSIVGGLVLAYGALLSAVASAVNGDNSRNGNSLINAINGFVNAIIKFHWILVGTFIAVMGAVLAIKAATFGIEHVVETALFTATKNLVISMLVGLLIPGLWESISKLVNKKETSISGIWDFILNYLGITVSYGATVINIIETTVESIKKKSFSWFFAGLTLAVSGFFLDAATSAYHLTGAWLQAADLAGALISGGGLLIMILAEIGSGKKDTTESTIETVSPLLSILQWIIAIGGFAKAILDYYGDQSTGWGG